MQKQQLTNRTSPKHRTLYWVYQHMGVEAFGTRQTAPHCDVIIMECTCPMYTVSSQFFPSVAQVVRNIVRAFPQPQNANKKSSGTYPLFFRLLIFLPLHIPTAKPCCTMIHNCRFYAFPTPTCTTHSLHSTHNWRSALGRLATWPRAKRGFCIDRTAQ